MGKPTIRVKPYDDRPSKAEHGQTFKVDATPEEGLARAVLRPVKVVKDSSRLARPSPRAGLPLCG